MHVALLSHMGGVQIGGSVVVGHFSQEEVALSLTAVHGPLATASWEIQMSKTFSEKLNGPSPALRTGKVWSPVDDSSFTLDNSDKFCLLWKPCAKCVGIST